MVTQVKRARVDSLWSLEPRLPSLTAARWVMSTQWVPSCGLSRFKHGFHRVCGPRFLLGHLGFLVCSLKCGVFWSLQFMSLGPSVGDSSGLPSSWQDAGLCFHPRVRADCLPPLFHQPLAVAHSTPRIRGWASSERPEGLFPSSFPPSPTPSDAAFFRGVAQPVRPSADPPSWGQDAVPPSSSRHLLPTLCGW